MFVVMFGLIVILCVVLISLACHQLRSSEQFRTTYAMEKGSHAWSSQATNKIMIKYPYVERFQRFVTKWRAQKVAGRI